MPGRGAILFCGGQSANRSHLWVLSFLSKHSIREPGVCLDEIAIALGVKGGNIQTILVESETEVSPQALATFSG